MPKQVLTSSFIKDAAITTAKLASSSVTSAKLDASMLKSVAFTVSSAELLALNATPKSLVAAPGAGNIHIPVTIAIKLTYATAAYAGIAAGEDLIVAYTNASGAQGIVVETTGFLDQASDQLRLANAVAAAITPVANAALVLALASGEITTGGGALSGTLWYRTVAI